MLPRRNFDKDFRRIALILLVTCPVCICLEHVEIFSEKINGITFGELSLFYEGRSEGLSSLISRPRYWFMAADDYKDNHMLLVRGYAIFTMNLDTKRTFLIAGQPRQSGYREGVGGDAVFNRITGLVASPVDYPSSILVADSLNACIRSVNRQSNETATFAGKCGEKKHATGTISNARFLELSGMVASHHDRNDIFVYDTKHLLRIRVWHPVSESTVFTMHSLVAGDSIASFILDYDGERLLGLDGSRIWSFNPLKAGRGLDYIIRRPSGHQDGPLNTVKLTTPSNFNFLSRDVLLVNDEYNYRVRVVDLKAQTMSSICVQGDSRDESYSPGNIRTCRMYRPKFVLKHPTELKILIASRVDVYQIPYSLDSTAATVPLTKPSTKSITPSANTSASVNLSSVPSDTSNQQAEDAKDSLRGKPHLEMWSNVALYAGIAIPSLAALVVLLGLCFLRYRANKRKNSRYSAKGANQSNPRSAPPSVPGTGYNTPNRQPEQSLDTPGQTYTPEDSYHKDEMNPTGELPKQDHRRGSGSGSSASSRTSKRHKKKSKNKKKLSAKVSM